MRLKKLLNLRKIGRRGKYLFLAYDQGIEHGPVDFNDKNVDPTYIIDIAKRGKYTGLVFQKGIAEKYNDEIRASKVPLILKLNGKTSLRQGDPISAQLTTVEEAVALGACAVGFTIYIGSEHEHLMFKELENIQRDAHKAGLPLIAWIYPRGKGTEGKKESELMAYATRVALELGVDIVKIHPVGKRKDFEWAVKSAGRVKVVAAGGSKTSEAELMKQIKTYMDAGFSGMAIGRNVWQASDPMIITEKIKKIIFG